jgi:mycothiol synthase
MASFDLRPARPDDIPAIADLVRLGERHDGIPRVMSDEELTEDLGASYVDLDLDTRVAVVDDRIVGWAAIWHPPAEAGIDRIDVDGVVDPASRGQGVGRVLLGWSVERARERAAALTHGLPTVIRADADDRDDERRRLFGRFGFVESRYSDELIQRLDGDLPAVDPPDGIRILPWDDARDEELRALRNETFADHWGSSAVDAELWQELVRGHFHRPDLSVFAVDEDDRAVGFSVNWHYPQDEEVTGRRDGEVAILGTSRPWRGRGVASSLIARSLAIFAEAGMTHGMIVVDTENPTGAARLYRSLGFEPVRRTVTYLLEP